MRLHWRSITMAYDYGRNFRTPPPSQKDSLAVKCHEFCLSEVVLDGAGSWDESLRLWHRIGHPSITAKSPSPTANAADSKQHTVPVLD